MKYGELKAGTVFFFEDNFEYPKRKTPHGHLDIRDGVTGYMPDDIPVITPDELSSMQSDLAAYKRVFSGMTPQEASGFIDESLELIKETKEYLKRLLGE